MKLTKTLQIQLFLLLGIYVFTTGCVDAYWMLTWTQLNNSWSFTPWFALPLEQAQFTAIARITIGIIILAYFIPKLRMKHDE